jgi:hypothetical protein
MRVRDVILSNADDAQTHREKLVRIVLDEMYQFVGLLAASGHALEINWPALEEVGIQPDESLIVGGELQHKYGRFRWAPYWVRKIDRAQLQNSRSGPSRPTGSGKQRTTDCDVLLKIFKQH